MVSGCAMRRAAPGVHAYVAPASARTREKSDEYQRELPWAFEGKLYLLNVLGACFPLYCHINSTLYSLWPSSIIIGGFDHQGMPMNLV